MRGLQAVEFGDVRSGGERVALACHHDDPYPGLGLDGVQCVVEEGDGVGADGVQPARAIESHDSDAVVDVAAQDGPLVHAMVRPPLTDNV